MNQRYQSADIRRVAEQFAENELYRAICSIGNQLESELEFGLCPEECFMDTQELLTDIIEKGEDFLAETENLWLRKYNEYKRFDRHMGDEDVRKAVGVVFGFTILAIDSSRHWFYRYTLPEQLTLAVANHQFDGWLSTLERIFSVPLSDGWFDAFMAEEPDVDCAKPSSASRKPKPPKQKNTGEKRLSGKPKTLKYCSHGNKGVLRKQGERIALVFKKWNEWGWIGSETSTDDFDALFEGEPRHCNMTWKVNTTILTILLQELLKQPCITKQKGQSPSSMVREQFGLTPNFDQKRLTDDDKFKIEVTVYLLNINNPLPRRSGGEDDEYETTDTALQAVMSGLLRTTKGI